MASQQQPRQLNLVVRFSNSLPDLPLELSELALVAAVKHEVRKAYPSLEPLTLHLIYSGQILSADKTLGELVKKKAQIPIDDEDKGKKSKKKRKKFEGKGKAKATDSDLEEQPIDDSDFDEDDELLPKSETIYLHCAPGGPRTDTDREEKISAAVRQFEERLRRESQGDDSRPPEQTEADADAQTAPAPRGFDRLLSAGLTPTEISQLRSEFEAIHDTTGLSLTEQRALEDAWIDEGAGSELADGSPRGVHEEVAIGLVCGFFFPVLFVLTARERWSKRRWGAIAIGVIANLIFGGGRWVG